MVKSSRYVSFFPVCFLKAWSLLPLDCVLEELLIPSSSSSSSSSSSPSSSFFHIGSHREVQVSWQNLFWLKAQGVKHVQLDGLSGKRNPTSEPQGLDISLGVRLLSIIFFDSLMMVKLYSHFSRCFVIYSCSKSRIFVGLSNLADLAFVFVFFRASDFFIWICLNFFSEAFEEVPKISAFNFIFTGWTLPWLKSIPLMHQKAIHVVRTLQFFLPLLPKNT